MTNRILVGSNFTVFKNRIINGDFSVWQRGTKFTIPTGTISFTYTADRFGFSNGSKSAGFTIEKSSDTMGRSWLTATVDTPPSDIKNEYIGGIVYQFEGQHLYDLAIRNKDITISFWFASNVTGEFTVALRNHSDTTTTVQSYVSTFTYNTANAYQKVEVTIPLNAKWNPSLKNDNNRGFQLWIGFVGQGNYVAPSTNTWIDGYYLTTSTAVNWGATAGNFIEIAELQLEEGNVATEFEYVPYDIQLMRCMRYYIKSSTILIARGYNSYGQVSILFPTKMRTVPTIIGNISSYDATNGSIYSYPEGIYIEAKFGTTYAPRYGLNNYWSADAEL